MKFLSFLSQYYYCRGIMTILTLAALVTSLKYYRRHRNLRIFTYYTAFSLLVTMTEFYYRTSAADHPFPGIVLLITFNAFMVFEFIVCNGFILNYIGSPRRRRIIRINGLVFFVLLIFFYILSFKHLMHAGYFLLESVFLVPPCLLYFYERFLTVNLQPLKEQPSFWVVTAVLFLNSCSIPLQLTFGYLGKYREAAFSLNYILYSIFFILLIRAYLCSPEK